MDIRRDDDHVAVLQRIALFAGCSRQDLIRIGSLTTELDVKAGVTLTEHGDPGLECFVIVEGWAVVDRDGRRLNRLGPGTFVGELALLDRGIRSATVIAETDMRLLVMSKREFNSLRGAVPDVADRMLVEMASRLRDADSMLDRGSAVPSEPPILPLARISAPR